jgi:tRNA uridine 5-carboxymethylaminomethyl modification enzyme
MLLRQDNAYTRLTQIGYDLGLASCNRLEILREKLEITEKLKELLEKEMVKPEQINPLLDSLNTTGIKQKCSLYSLLERPQISIKHILEWDRSILTSIRIGNLLNLESTLNYLESEIKYAGYVGRERIIADKMIRLENLSIRDNIDYSSIDSLSTEAKQKLIKIHPKTIGQAARVPGVSPADINVLLVHMGR